MPMERSLIQTANAAGCHAADGVYVNAEAVLRLLVDIKRLWDAEGFGSNDQISEPLYNRLNSAIGQISGSEVQ